MAPMQISLTAGKADYNWDEAAKMLGLSSTELQTLVVDRLGENDQEKSFSKMRFRPTDLILLNMMQAGTPLAEAEQSA